ncbi:Os01g0804150 [Oryza sativa Japonica Group]|uniref:Os01g0804150 protein n=1 Tax=Oryza sativa subsp. japonica TaxID=39947 RepID=A0A0P0V9B4_ORYSJ|nr:hypothetical protein EE612_006339 [Oryza sativa]BAS74820.1 Os01g0804150 [Oryza sativa Japonica Group]
MSAARFFFLSFSSLFSLPSSSSVRRPVAGGVAMAACFRCAQSAAAASGPAGPNRLPPAGRRCPSPWCTTPWPPRGSAAVAGRSKSSSGLLEAEREHCGVVVDDGGTLAFRVRH